MIKCSKDGKSIIFEDRCDIFIFGSILDDTLIRNITHNPKKVLSLNIYQESMDLFVGGYLVETDGDITIIDKSNLNLNGINLIRDLRYHKIKLEIKSLTHIKKIKRIGLSMYIGQEELSLNISNMKNQIISEIECDNMDFDEIETHIDCDGKIKYRINYNISK